MFKSITIFTIIFAFSVCYGENVVKNGDFENTGAGWGLSKWTGSKATFEFDSTEVHSGKNSLKVVNTGSKDYQTFIAQTIKVKPDTRYRLSFYLKTENVVPRPKTGVNGAGVYITSGKALFVGCSGRWKMCTGTNDWKKYVATFKTGPDMNKASFYLTLNYSTGTVWFDDIVLEEVDGSKSTAPAKSPEPAKEKSAAVNADQETSFSGIVFNDVNSNGILDAGEPGLADIQVSDGLNIVKSDKDGQFKLGGERISTPPFVFISKPSGFRCTTAFYLPAGSEKLQFGLHKKKDSGKDFTFYQVADSEVGWDEKFWLKEIKDAQAYYKADFIIHSGDIIGLKAHSEFMKELGLPVYYAIGNHDYRRVSKYAEADFEKYLGPLYYSFNYGPVHFIQLGYDGRNDGPPKAGFAADQRQWLKSDIALVPADMKIVVLRHHPLRYIDGNQKIIRALKGRLLAFVAGHTHNAQARSDENGTLHIESPPPNRGGIDHSPRAFRVISYHNGKFSVETRIGNQKHLFTIVYPAGTISAEDKKTIMVNAYDSSSPVKSVEWSSGSAWNPMKQVGPWTWRCNWTPSGKTVKVRCAFADGKVIEKTAEFKTGGKSPDIVPVADWPMFLKNALRNAVAESVVNPPLNLKWVASTGQNIGFSSPVICNNKIFIGTLDDNNGIDAAVIAYDAVSGKELWRTVTGCSFKNSLAADETCVYGATLDGTVYALLQSDGKIVWKKSVDYFKDSDGLYGAAAVKDGKLYVGSDRLAVFDCKTGKKLWEDNKRTAMSAACYPSVIVDDSKVYSAQNWRYGLFANDIKSGKFVWNLKRNRDFTYFDGTPTMANNLIYVKLRSWFFVVDPASGKIVNEAPKDKKNMESVSSPLVADGRIIFGASAGLICLDASTLKEIWRFSPGKSIVASIPYIKDGANAVYASPVISGNVIYVGGGDGVFYALDINSGKKLWSFNIGAPIYSTAAISGNLVAVSAFDGNIYAFAGTGK